METVDQAAAAVHAEVSPWRTGATLLIACGITAADLREMAAKPGNPDAERDLALAGEVGSLTARGLTQRHAQRARGYNLSDLAVGEVAKAHLAEGFTPARVRKDETRRATPSRARFLARVAAAMDEQLARQARMDALAAGEG